MWLTKHITKRYGTGLGTLTVIRIKLQELQKCILTYKLNFLIGLVCMLAGVCVRMCVRVYAYVQR